MPPTGHEWPDGLLPLVHHDPDWDCLDASTGRIVAFYWQEVDEDIDAAQFARAFQEPAPTLEAWLEEWVASPVRPSGSRACSPRLKGAPRVMRARRSPG
jgi:hypothetical protein